MEKEWKIKHQETLDFKKIAGEYHPVILKLLGNRGFQNSEEIKKFFEFDYDTDIGNPFVFFEMEKAVKRIIIAKEGNEKVAIFGDYDADGVTASALLFETLSYLGFTQVITYIPDRQIEGYGMNKEALNFLQKEKVNLIITVDCGITNREEVALAKERGIDVIITDHHHVPEELPEALAIINPQKENSGYGFKNLAGVGVAFKLAQALYQKIDSENIEKLKWLLDLVAIGTVADCVPLLGENRVLVKYGLVVLSKTRRAGLLEMFKVGRIKIGENDFPDTHKIAFQVAPRINAAGRMDHANFAYNLILEKDRVKACDLALEIEAKNQQRQKITGEIVREVKILAEGPFKDKELIFAESEHWPVGILGLVAGKVADEFNKPTAVFQKQENEMVGSLRSIPQINIIEKIEKCSKLLEKFGGHAQAAGVTLKKENFDSFYKKLSQLIAKELGGKKTYPTVEIDLEITSQDINWELLSEIRKMEPFGKENEEPVFLVRNLKIQEIRMVGNGSKHLKLSVMAEDSPKVFDGIGFGMGEKFSQIIKVGDKVDLVVNLQEDEWNGNRKIQLQIIDLKKSG
ncbi:single-stranded-DNA-specific exonuclease RecJ [Patescibacteria group bacterium]|nr:single-stranded-DNA-specific exonuclease RecJ [Patescibacteria group bacterium]